MYETAKKYLKEQAEKGVDIYHLYQQAGHAFAGTTRFFANWSDVLYLALGQMAVMDINNRRYYINCVDYSSVKDIPNDTDKFVDNLCDMEKDLKMKIGNENKRIYVRMPPTFTMDVLSRKMALWCDVGFQDDNDPGVPFEETGEFIFRNLPSIKRIDSAKTIEWLERWARR